MHNWAVFVSPVFLLTFMHANGFSQDNLDQKEDEKQRWFVQKPEVQLTQFDVGPDNPFHVLPGFQIELLYTVPKPIQGSWVSMTFDNKGRIIACDQGGTGLYRITPPRIGSDEETKIEDLDAEISGAQGLLYAFDSLYVSVNGRGSGLYRLRDTNGDDQFDEEVKLKPFRGGGEHGPHAVRLSPDGRSIYVIAGNHTDPPENLNHRRLQPDWNEDLLLPRQWDARGHARGKLAPGGWIAKTDPDGVSWEIVSNGYRNPYDFDFNADGEIMAYDADMEWDFGTPWYRPTRLCHAISGSEFGWRSGTGKWPTYFHDSLPAVVDIGPGSPVGVTFGYGAKFPAKYQKALYLLDWTFGTMYAIHLDPSGASYKGTKEEFVSRVALPLTDAAVGPDGALYFTVGGRGTQSALYRVTYVGNESTAKTEFKNGEGRALRAIRRRLEELQKQDAKIDMHFVWENLGHSDRHIRYAARTALEHAPVDQWRDRALQAPNPITRVNALAGLVRATGTQVADKETKLSTMKSVVNALLKIEFDACDKFTKLAILRTYSLAFIRLAPPSIQVAAQVNEALEPKFPSNDPELDRELSRVLVYLNAPSVIQKTLQLMEQPFENNLAATEDLLKRNPGYGRTIAAMMANQPELQKIHFAFVLRNMRYGWTLEERKSYFKLLDEATQRSGGESYKGFIRNIRAEAMANLSEDERQALESDVIAKPIPAEELPQPIGPGRAWTVDEIVKLAESKMTGRNFEQGKQTFAAAKCATCHRFDGRGGATGSDLTSVAGRFNYRDLCDSVVHPSKVISDQYRASQIITEDGLVVNGRIVGDANGEITVQTNPEDATVIKTLKKDSIEEINPSKTSLMPEKLLNPFNENEVLDLLAYLMSRGNPNDLRFAK